MFFGTRKYFPKVVDIIQGSFIIAQRDSEGNFTSLSDQLYTKYKLKFSIPDTFHSTERGLEIDHREPMPRQGQADE